MQCNIESGRVDKARWYPSPNHDARPHPHFINALIIHAISLPPGIFGDEFVEAFFCNTLDSTQHPYFETIRGVHVSSHFYIKRNGQLIQFVATHERAWHAGKSSLNSHAIVNDFSIGIELEGCDELPFSDAQYASLISVSQTLMDAYPAIRKNRIVGHCDIAPTRKTDPGPCFDWCRYKCDL